jgi:cytochrome c peroxidase
MHDGRFNTIRQVLNHYDAGVVHSKTLAIELENGTPLTSKEKVDLTAFLLTLTDKDFLFNPDFAFPKK